MGHDRRIMTIKWPEAWREILAWTIGGISILVLCLIAIFPYGMLQARVLAELTRATGMEIRVADWTVGIPLGLEWQNITLSQPNWAPIQLSLLQAKLGVMKALGGTLGLDIIAKLNDTSSSTGLAKGTVTASSFSLQGPVTIKGQVQQVDLSKVLRRYVTQGTLNGDFSHRVDSGQATLTGMKGEGTWAAEATDLVIDQIPLGNGRTLSLTFGRVSAGLACRDLRCDVTQLKGDGIDGSFTGEGHITIQQPMQQSQLNLTVTVIPGHGFASKAGTLGLPSPPPGTPMTVKIVGTLAQAKIAL
ncbi:type II secretion system protein GspN [Nitrospira sp. BLG_2]|uniref:type II secretion system protein GspN n=1 Tax=Nitrospira sp. BLG_2 TaxID=3397507 RepID=UPI003B9B7D24